MTLKKRSSILKGLEVTLFTLTIAFVGYLVDHQDPLLIHYPFSFLVLWLAIVTLFYGLAMGLVMWIVFGLFSSIIYVDDALFTSLLLENLFFVFLYGFFFSNLQTKINKQTIRNDYLQLRLKELTNAFFTLKISHDKLESIYITQPASFRFIISEVLEKWEHDTPEKSADNTLKVIEKFFSVKSATIWGVRNGKLQRPLGFLGKIEQIDTKDALVQEAILLRKSIYLKDLEEKEQTSYIFAVPFLDKRKQVTSILIIKEIPFIFYQEETLLKINVVFTYIWAEYKKRFSLSKAVEKQNHNLPIRKHLSKQEMVDFRIEIERLQRILEDFNIESRIYVISTKNSYIHESISDFFYETKVLEILDQYISLQCGEEYIHLVLFPFVSKSGIFQTSKDFDNTLHDIENHLKLQSIDEGLKHTLTNTSSNSKNISVKNFDELLKEFNCYD